jgi:hypothetical protein
MVMVIGDGLGLADDKGKIAVCFQAIVKAQTDSTHLSYRIWYNTIVHKVVWRP